MDFSEKLKLLLQTKQITQRELATAINEKPGTVSAWVRGLNTPRLSKVRKIAEYFGVSVASLTDPDSQVSLVEADGEEGEALECFRNLNPRGRDQALIQLRNLSRLPEYSSSGTSAPEVFGKTIEQQIAELRVLLEELESKLPKDEGESGGESHVH